MCASAIPKGLAPRRPDPKHTQQWFTAGFEHQNISEFIFSRQRLKFPDFQTLVRELQHGKHWSANSSVGMPFRPNTGSGGLTGGGVQHSVFYLVFARCKLFWTSKKKQKTQKQIKLKHKTKYIYNTLQLSRALPCVLACVLACLLACLLDCLLGGLLAGWLGMTK